MLTDAKQKTLEVENGRQWGRVTSDNFQGSLVSYHGLFRPASGIILPFYTHKISFVEISPRKTPKRYKSYEF